MPSIKHIAIVEPHYHTSYLHASVRIAESCNLETTVYTTKDVWNESQEFFNGQPKAEVLLFDDIASLLRKVVSESDKFDVVVFNTIQILEWQNLLKIAFGTWKCPFVVTLHNPVYWFEHKGYPLYRIRAKLRLICRNLILEKSAGLIFLGERMLNYARSRGYEKPLCLLPYGIFEKSVDDLSESTEPVTFGVLGTINQNRDYDMLLRVFENVLAEPGKKLSLSLLGAPFRDHGKRIISECDHLREKGLKVKYWEVDYVTEQAIQNEMAEVDFVILLLSDLVFADGLKVSGTLFDAVRFKKPFLVPDFYQFPTGAEESALKYGSEKELLDLVQRCRAMGSDERVELKLAADSVAAKFMPAKWASGLRNFLENI